MTTAECNQGSSIHLMTVADIQSSYYYRTDNSEHELWNV